MRHRAQGRTDPTCLPARVAARRLVDEADYASLVLWGGRVLHGLRFAVVDERLVLLAPARLAQSEGDHDLACRVLVCGPVSGSTGEPHWVSIAFGGWAVAVPASRREAVALDFVDRHVTADLFDLGERWMFLEIGLAELTVRTARDCVGFDADEATELLTRSPGVHVLGWSGPRE